jgi:hypothetical protein
VLPLSSPGAAFPDPLWKLVGKSLEKDRPDAPVSIELSFSSVVSYCPLGLLPDLLFSKSTKQPVEVPFCPR